MQKINKTFSICHLWLNELQCECWYWAQDISSRRQAKYTQIRWPRPPPSSLWGVGSVFGAFWYLSAHLCVFMGNHSNLAFILFASCNFEWCTIPVWKVYPKPVSSQKPIYLTWVFSFETWWDLWGGHNFVYFHVAEPFAFLARSITQVAALLSKYLTLCDDLALKSLGA